MIFPSTNHAVSLSVDHHLTVLMCRQQLRRSVFLCLAFIYLSLLLLCQLLFSLFSFLLCFSFLDLIHFIFLFLLFSVFISHFCFLSCYSRTCLQFRLQFRICLRSQVDQWKGLSEWATKIRWNFLNSKNFNSSRPIFTKPDYAAYIYKGVV